MRGRRHRRQHRQRVRGRRRGQPHQPPALKGPAIPGHPGPRRLLPALASGLLYLAALVAARWLPDAALWGAAGVLLLPALASLALRRSLDGPTVLVLWPPLHFLLICTGSAGSALTPLAAAWVVALGRLRPRLAFPAAAVAGVLVPVAHPWVGGVPVAADVVRHAVLVTAAAALAWALAAREGARPARASEPARPEPRPEPKPFVAPPDAETVDALLELVRRATAAAEATLWRQDADGRSAALLGRAADDAVPPPEPVVALDGHPFGWTILEGMPVHLERGRRDLPAPWAAEMLLVPVDAPEGVLALAYPAGVPRGAEATALVGGRQLAALLALLTLRATQARTEREVRSLAKAVRILSGTLEMDRFAEQLAASACEVTGAAGAAVARAPDEFGIGRILHVASPGGEAPRLADFGESDSRTALAVKHGVELSVEDLRRETDRVPVLTPGEQWPRAPRSVAIAPLLADGRSLGAVVAWHPEPGCFGEKEMELLRLLASTAPRPMQSAERFGTVEQKATTDSLTALPNRRTFEARLSSAAAYHERYGRPFALAALDVDHFKKVNDTFGHEAGDRVLQHVAEVLRTSVRDVDLAARIGGEEFVVLMPETSLRAAQEAAERIRRTLEARPVFVDGRPLSVTASVGVAAVPDCTASAAELQKLADEALYRAKGGGRNRVTAAPRVSRAGAE